MHLTRDHTCQRNLNWRTDVAPEVVDGVVQELLATDRYHLAGTMPFLVTLESTDKSRVIVVPRTGRIQIRVNYEIPTESRRLAAEAIFADIAKGVLRFTTRG